ncbi:hypothetical protein B0H16DRAFT_1471344 [Mycena metata]|uniref:Uncharacterized protein n=1 Tax=Mycena metata TaxID=1033252 RepID=A0AAD7MP51_9AGAR|nr:hypothetical protein B0H16DRAFT_1471344 [Mycena metata]
MHACGPRGTPYTTFECSFCVSKAPVVAIDRDVKEENAVLGNSMCRCWRNTTGNLKLVNEYSDCVVVLLDRRWTHARTPVLDSAVGRLLPICPAEWHNGRQNGKIGGLFCPDDEENVVEKAAQEFNKTSENRSCVAPTPGSKLVPNLMTLRNWMASTAGKPSQQMKKYGFYGGCRVLKR